jgi:hypothetical protein
MRAASTTKNPWNGLVMLPGTMSMEVKHCCTHSYFAQTQSADYILVDNNTYFEQSGYHGVYFLVRQVVDD